MRHHLDLEKMNEAAAHLLGTHDFSCFEKVGGNNATSICTITEALWMPYTPTHVEMLGYPCEEGDYIVFRIKADRFLRNMVRAIVGSMIEVGSGKKDPDWMASLVASGTRSDAGASVPGNALFFSGAKYAGECSETMK
jgi:tRNA pseudouridine38-40 synthase